MYPDTRPHPPNIKPYNMCTSHFCEHFTLSSSTLSLMYFLPPFAQLQYYGSCVACNFEKFGPFTPIQIIGKQQCNKYLIHTHISCCLTVSL